MENPLWNWVIFALVLAVVFMPFEHKKSIEPSPLEHKQTAKIEKEVHKDTHKLHFSMSPFWTNSDGVLPQINRFH